MPLASREWKPGMSPNTRPCRGCMPPCLPHANSQFPGPAQGVRMQMEVKKPCLRSFAFRASLYVRYLDLPSRLPEVEGLKIPLGLEKKGRHHSAFIHSREVRISLKQRINKILGANFSGEKGTSTPLEVFVYK